ncbi:DUF4190 domain-containing protein [Amycolatopsis sp. NPDC059657]|uniref:DUF4190 domain-containing protein n=1 Tax=Amycolatopsis sp. NPDC059657 TaxID=3346899 RepID=UPI003671B84F
MTEPSSPASDPTPSSPDPVADATAAPSPSPDPTAEPAPEPTPAPEQVFPSSTGFASPDPEPDPYGAPPAPEPFVSPGPESFGTQPPYGQGYQYGYAPTGGPYVPPPSSGLAIGALVSSIAGLLTCGLAAIAGVIMGHIAYNQAKRGQAGGEGMALSAIIVGYVMLALWAGVLAAAIVSYTTGWSYR